MRLIIVLLSIEGEEGDNGDELAMGRPAAAATAAADQSGNTSATTTTTTNSRTTFVQQCR